MMVGEVTIKKKKKLYCFLSFRPERGDKPTKTQGTTECEKKSEKEIKERCQ